MYSAHCTTDNVLCIFSSCYENCVCYYRQLLQMTDFFDWIFLYDHIYPLALLLSSDKVSEVRNSANLLVSANHVT